ncbi:hypothetical protein C5167_042492, partial [Papaver somniferum]
YLADLPLVKQYMLQAKNTNFDGPPLALPTVDMMLKESELNKQAKKFHYACHGGIIKSTWASADGGASDENNVLSLWFYDLNLLLVTDGDNGRYFTKKSCVEGFPVETLDTAGSGDALLVHSFVLLLRIIGFC